LVLHHKILGEGFPVIVLHGLFGSGANWQSVANALAKSFRVILVDLRNHGSSPHSEIMNYSVMVEDISELQTSLAFGKADLLGHSMGGKVAMHFSQEYPEQVRKLVVVDAAPKQYPPWHRGILDALLGLDLNQPRTRAEIESVLEPAIPDLAVRRFLLMNLRADPQGRWYWRLGVQEINANYDQLNAFPVSDGKFPGPTLFIRGQKSEYIKMDDLGQIRVLFPRAEIVTIPEAGHWVHADALKQFTALTLEFLKH
jgi:pimeloyl-ACP methyl ester carboxylesterase